MKVENIQLKDIPNNTLYHYTNIDGFKGIIKNRELWFTHFRDLDDNREIIHGFDIIYKEAQKHISKIFYDIIKKSSSEDIYIFSTCVDFIMNIYGKNMQIHIKELL